MNAKFKMPKYGREIKLNNVVKETLLTIIATSISIILTFGTAHYLEQRQKEQTRKIMAMTVIHDMDVSLNTLRFLLNKEEEGANITRYLMEHIDQLDEVADDTLFRFLGYISSSSWNTNEEFKKSNENIFNSSQESWRTLDDRTFITNVQDFYHSRGVLERVFKEWMYFRKPVSDEELYQITMASEGMADRVHFLPVCRELLGTVRVKRWLETSEQRTQLIRSFLEKAIDINEENKFLMNISQKDLDEFVATTIKKVRPVTEKDMIGKWKGIASDQYFIEYNFNKDHTFDVHFTIYWQAPIYYGRMIVHQTASGKWAIENDSIVSYFDLNSAMVNVDENGITYQPEKVDSIRTYKQQLSQMLEQNFLSQFQANPRAPRASNIDRTGQRLELTNPQGETTHYQRVVEEKEK